MADPELAQLQSALADAGRTLFEGCESRLGPWVEARVLERLEQSGTGVTPDGAELARRAGENAWAQVAAPLRAALLEEADGATPLSLVRSAVGPATEALAELGVPGVVRDGDAVGLFPDDEYDLTPGAWTDIDPTLGEPGLRWSAAKAMLTMRRHR